MKKLFIIAMAAFFCASMSAKQEIKYESNQKTPKEIKKEAKKEAKKLYKDGWKQIPGANSLETQIEKRMQMENEPKCGPYNKYFISNGLGTSKDRGIASNISLMQAKSNLAGQIQTEIKAAMTNSEDQTIIEGASKFLKKYETNGNQIIEQNLSNIIPILTLYREKKDGTIEVESYVSCESSLLIEKLYKLSDE